MSKARVLIVDDEKNILSSLSRALVLEDYEPVVAGSAELGLEKLAQESVDLVLLDVTLPGMDGIACLEKLHQERPELPVVMMSAHGNIQLAVEATKLGARDFVEKPLSLPKLFLTLDNTLQLESLTRENRELKRWVDQRYELVGESDAIRDLMERVRVTAPTNGRVLITGEHGTGKELVARAIHAQSRRAAAPFVKLNCAAVPTELIESELFGHEKGSFTGAVTSRRGKFELAHRGTLFLDEVGDMRLEMQAKLLRVLQENEFERVGSGETIRVDVRVLAATNKELENEIEAERFRGDLYYRLNVVPFHVPPLRDRNDDIGLLAAHFAEMACADNGVADKRFTDSALEALADYHWPGNVRELKNIVERLVILTAGASIDAGEVRDVLPATAAAPATLARAAEATALKDKMAAAEHAFLLEGLQRNRWQIAKTARELGLERSHLYKKMKLHDIQREES